MKTIYVVQDSETLHAFAAFETLFDALAYIDKKPHYIDCANVRVVKVPLNVPGIEKPVGTVPEHPLIAWESA